MNLVACARCGREVSTETGVYHYPEGPVCKECHTGRRPRTPTPAQEPEVGPHGEKMLTEAEMDAIAAHAESVLEG